MKILENLSRLCYPQMYSCICLKSLFKLLCTVTVSSFDLVSSHVWFFIDLLVRLPFSACCQSGLKVAYVYRHIKHGIGPSVSSPGPIPSIVSSCWRLLGTILFHFPFFLQFHHSWLPLNLAASFRHTNYLIFSQKPEFQDLSGRC